MNDSNPNLETLTRRMPSVGEAMVIELVNSVQVAEDIVRFRAGARPVDRLLRKLFGDIDRQDALDGALSAAVRALHELAIDGEMGLARTNRAVTTVAVAVERLRNRVAALETRSEDVERLDLRLDDIEAALGKRLHNVSRVVNALTLRVEAGETIAHALRAWKAGRTYSGLPWILQVWLLVHEIFSSSAVLAVNDTDLRVRVVDELDGAFAFVPASFSIADVLDAASASIVETDAQFLIAFFQSQLAMGTFTTTLALTLELGTVTELARPPKPGWCAIEVVRGRGGKIDFWMERLELLTAFVNELALPRQEGA